MSLCDQHIDTGTPRKLRRKQLRIHATGASVATGLTAQCQNLRRDPIDVADQFRLAAVRAVRVSIIEPVDIREQDQSVRRDDARHDGRQAVVIAKRAVMQQLPG